MGSELPKRGDSRLALVQIVADCESEEVVHGRCATECKFFQRVPCRCRYVPIALVRQTFDEVNRDAARGMDR